MGYREREYQRNIYGRSMGCLCNFFLRYLWGLCPIFCDDDDDDDDDDDAAGGGGRGGGGGGHGHGHGHDGSDGYTMSKRNKKTSDTKVDSPNGTVIKPRKYVALELSKVTPHKNLHVPILQSRTLRGDHDCDHKTPKEIGQNH